jgi:hypothetical protein
MIGARHLARKDSQLLFLWGLLPAYAVPRAATGGYETHSDNHSLVRNDVRHRASALPLEQGEHA